VPAKTVKEFVDYVKANPGKVNFGSSGSGTSLHLTAEMLKMVAGLDMVHVPYKGGAEALGALLGGHVDALAVVVKLVAGLDLASHGRPG